MEKKHILIGIVGAAAVDALAILFGLRSAEAAVSVRPKLKEVGFWDAAFTNHAGDWLYYHEPALGAIFTSVFVLPVAFFFIYTGISD